MIGKYVAANGMRLLAVLFLVVGFSFGVIDPSAAIAGGILMETAPDLKTLEAEMKRAFATMQDGIKRAQDVANNAIEEVRKEGTIHGETNKKLTSLSEANAKLGEDFGIVRAQVLELAQKLGTTPQAGGEDQKDLVKIITDSDAWKSNQKAPVSATRMDPVVVENFHQFMRPQATALMNPNPYTNDQPLVPAQRVPGIITPAEQRLYIRDLLPQGRASSNLIEFVSESAFTNSARPQGDTSPVGHGEGELKAESGFTFALASAGAVTIAHFVPASRQVLSDANMLQGYLGGRLLYGLKLEEEQELLTGTGAAGELNGLNNQAAAFEGGVTNATILDTLLRAILQVSLSNYEASAFVLHPRDWFNAMLLKDSQNRYLFSDPQSMVAPRVWAKPVVASQSQNVGRFLCGAFSLGAQIWDVWDANVRISENVNDHFLRNMVAILAEERLIFTVYRSTAFVYGNVAHTG